MPKILTIGDLRKAIADAPDDMPIEVRADYGNCCDGFWQITTELLPRKPGTNTPADNAKWWAVFQTDMVTG